MVGHIISIVLIISSTIVGRSLTGEACPTSRRHERGILRLGAQLFFGRFAPLLCYGYKNLGGDVRKAETRRH